MAALRELSAPLLPDHPPLLHREKHGESTAWVSPDLPAAMARSNGQWSLNDFQLTKQLYKGKASTLYQAVDRPSGSVVALKSYSKRRLSQLNWYQVEREVRLHAQLRHPNIITLHAAFEDDNYVFMVTEYAEGGDLYEDLKRAGGQLKERAVAGEVLPQFMSALTYMHAHSIVHRDIKPENILLSADRTIKVADFGLSINWSEERPVTRAGTLDYMSPEVLACPEKSKPEENKERVELGYTDAVDVWAVGILAYELLVGRPPFERESREETYQYIQHKQPTLPVWMSEAARDFIMSALAKSPRRRPSMAQLLQHPWIQLHSRRPSIPPSSPAASDLHLPLDELAGSAGQPFSDLHRHSLHGAKSVRDFSSLLSPATSATSPMMTSLLQPALSMASPAMAAAASAALGGSGGLRPATGSRLAHGPDPRPTTPIAMGLQQGLPGPAFAVAGEAADASVSQHHGDVPSTVHHSQFSVHSVATRLLSPSFNVQQATASPVAAAPGEQSAFLELYKSMGPPAAERPQGGVSHTPRGSSRKSSVTSITRPGNRNSTHSKEPLPPLPPQQYQDGAPPPPIGPERLPSLRKAVSQPRMLQDGEHLPAATSVAAVPAAAAAVSAAAAAAAAGVPASLTPAGSSHVEVEHAAVESLPKAAAEETHHASQPSVAHPVLQTAGPSRELEHSSALEAIPEQGSTAGSEAPSHGEIASEADGGHMLMPAHKKQPPMDAEEAAAEVGIPAVHAAAPQLSSRQQQGQRDDPEPVNGESSGEVQPGKASPMLSAQALAHNRMREAEQRHVDKLRARATGRAASPAGESAVQHSQQPEKQRSRAASLPDVQRSVDKSRARSASIAAPPPAAAKQREGSPGYGAGLARSAGALFSKLLGKKQDAAPGNAGAAGSSAGAAGSNASSAAGSGVSTSGTSSSAARKPSLTAVQRSAASSTSLTRKPVAAHTERPRPAPRKPSTVVYADQLASLGAAAGGGADVAAEAAVVAPPKTKVPLKHRLSPPPVPGAMQAAGLQHSPRSRPSQLHASSSSLVHRHPVAQSVRPAVSGDMASNIDDNAVVMLRSPVGSARRAAVPGQSGQAGTIDLLCSAAEAATGSGSHTSAHSSVDEEAETGVDPRSSSKSVRFAGSLATAGPSGEMDTMDLIPALHQTDSASFTTAFSSLPASSLPSLTTGSASPLLRTSRKGSVSPATSRKGSLLAPSTSRGSLLRTAGASGSGSLLRTAGASGSGTLAGLGPKRGSKTASMPGEAARAATMAAAARIDEGDEEEEGGLDGDAVESAVQRSAASWSHPARASSSPKAAPAARKSSASAARLSMYLAMQKKRSGGSSNNSSGSGGRASLLHRPGDGVMSPSASPVPEAH